MPNQFTKKDASARFDAMISADPNTGCHLWTGSVTSVGGYGKFTLDGNGGTVLAHRWAWERDHGPIVGRLVVRHLVCNQPSCVNVAHMAIGTHAENSADMKSQGRQAMGERCHTAKLTSAQVLSIRAEYALAPNASVIGRKYGVDYSNIIAIVNRKSWTHI